mmetsp:Transcript_137609/g.253107  ORF Transcript_137609/g.253107 Transcript_137609/m.253107 type:complete len:248 (-) Transcript_137609:126-869(-)
MHMLLLDVCLVACTQCKGHHLLLHPAMIANHKCVWPFLERQKVEEAILARFLVNYVASGAEDFEIHRGCLRAVRCKESSPQRLRWCDILVEVLIRSGWQRESEQQLWYKAVHVIPPLLNKAALKLALDIGRGFTFAGQDGLAGYLIHFLVTHFSGRASHSARLKRATTPQCATCIASVTGACIAQLVAQLLCLLGRVLTVDDDAVWAAGKLGEELADNLHVALWCRRIDLRKFISQCPAAGRCEDKR